MTYKVLIVLLSLSVISLSAMQQERSDFDEFAVVFHIQVPDPLREIPEKGIDLTNEQAIIRYLETLNEPNDIPSSIYDFLIKKTTSSDVSEPLSNILLRIWGINPDILISGKEDLVKSIGTTMLDVKNAQRKK